MAIARCATICHIGSRRDASAIAQNLSSNTSLLACALFTRSAIAADRAFVISLAIAGSAAILIVCGWGYTFAITQNLSGDASLLAGALFAGCAVAASLSSVVALTIAGGSAIQIVRGRGDALAIAKNLACYASLLAGTLLARCAHLANGAFMDISAIVRGTAIQIIGSRGHALTIAKNLSGNASLFAHTALA